MREIAIYYDDVWQSIFGAMLFPDDPEMARHHVAAFHIKSTPCRGNELKLETMERLRAETKKRNFAGQRVGEVVKVLLAQTFHHPDKGFDAAILHASRGIWKINRELGASRSLVRKHLSLFAPAL